MDSAEQVSQTLTLEQISNDLRLFGAKLDYIAEELKTRPTLQETSNLIDLKIKVNEVKMGGRLDTLENRMASWEELGNRIGTSVENSMIGLTDKVTRLMTENESLGKHIKEITDLAKQAIDIAQKAMNGTREFGNTFGEAIKNTAAIVDSWSGINQAGQTQLNSLNTQVTSNTSEVRRIDALLQDTDVRTTQMFNKFEHFGVVQNQHTEKQKELEVLVRNMASSQASTLNYVRDLEDRAQEWRDFWRKTRRIVFSPTIWTVIASSPIYTFISNRLGLALDDLLQLRDFIQGVIHVFENLLRGL